MITLICGPMYSGKSTMLVQKMERYIYAKKNICLIRPKKDDRGYFTHNGVDNIKSVLKENDGYFEINEFTDLNDFSKYSAIFVDEYFMIKNCKLLCSLLDTDIYFAGLLASSENKLFTEAEQILPYCDEIFKLNGVCVEDGSQYGNYSGYFGTAKKTSEILVGDTAYKCLCRKCYLKAFGKI
jgi:thymidine kinase